MEGMRTLVLRVRFSTEPALMMRSNSKQPFWLTGDMIPAAGAWASTLEKRVWAGVLSGIGMGLAGVCCALSAMAAGVYMKVPRGCGEGCGVRVCCAGVLCRCKA